MTEEQPAALPGLRYDVGFVVRGMAPPPDHGYALFGALCRVLGDLHGAPWLQVLPLSASRGGAGGSGARACAMSLRLRVTPERIGSVVALAGTTLDVAGARLSVGVPSVFPLHPASALASRLVTFKHHVEEASFAEHVAGELARKGVRAEAQIGRRRIVSVAGAKIVGFGVALRGLTQADSLRMQYEGLGGRQRFGCGVFGPLTPEGLADFGARRVASQLREVGA